MRGAFATRYYSSLLFSIYSPLTRTSFDRGVYTLHAFSSPFTLNLFLSLIYIHLVEMAV